MSNNWIRVSERVPDDNRDVQITIELSGGERAVQEDFYDATNKKFCCDCRGYKVIAWREFEEPQPYKGKP